MVSFKVKNVIKGRISCGKFVLYEDENDNFHYEKGIYSTITFNWYDKKKALTINDRKGTFPGIPDSRKFNIVIANANKGGGENMITQPDKEITYSSKKLTVRF